MDWNSRIPCWDFGEDQFEQGTIPGNSVTATVFGKSSGSGSRRSQAAAAGGMTDLKLGQLIEDMKVPNVSKMTLSPSGSSKRARALSIQAAAAAACLVDGCVADLTNCREYHRRHKVCELHSKSPQVTINGHKQRFCQQCSRFHSLEEFDEGKRSCRKRLDGHNRRRRKPQPESLSRVGSIFSSQQSLDDRFNGSTMLQFSNPHAYQTTTVANPIWGGIVKAEEDAMYYNKYSHLPEKQNPHLFPESSSSSNRGSSGKQQQFSLFHSSTSLKLNNHTLSPKGLSFASSETSSSNEKLFCDGYPGPGPARVVHSDCALSLLSSSSSQTSCMSLGHTMHHPNSFSTANPLDQSVLDYSISEPMMVHNGGGSSSVVDVHCQGMVHMGLRDNETPQTLPFYWE